MVVLIMIFSFPLLGLIYSLFFRPKTRHQLILVMLSLFVCVFAIILCVFYTFIIMVLPYFAEPVIVFLYYTVMPFLFLLQAYVCFTALCDKRLKLYDMILLNSWLFVQKFFAKLENLFMLYVKG